MPNKSTNPGCGIDDPAMPSFIRQLRDPDGAADLAGCFDYWSPAITGYAPLDIDLGRQHCKAAMACARQLGSANLLLYVVMAMHGRPVGDVERGFLAELISPALVGRIPAFVPDEVMQAIARDGGDVGALRRREAFMARAIDHCRNNPGPFCDYVIDLISGRHGEGIGAAICLLVGAALNGGLH